MKASALRTLELLTLIGGIGLVSFGAWSIYQPLGFIAGGAGCIWLALPE